MAERHPVLRSRFYVKGSTIKEMVGRDLVLINAQDLLLTHLESGRRMNPGGEAVWTAEASLSRAELEARSSQLAHHLRSMGVGPDVMVGICTERSLEMVVGLLAIIKAGGAYVPIDPDYPDERIDFMLQDASPPVLLTQRHLFRRLPSTDAVVFNLDADWKKVATLPTDPPVVELAPEDLAYMIYTSGSTGRPKGAMNTHRGIVNRLIWMQDIFQLSTNDAVLQKTPFSFDVSVWEFFLPLMTGSRLVLARPGGHRDPGYLARLINEQNISLLHFVPSMLEVFLGQPNLNDYCRSVHAVVCSGEALSFDLKERFFDTLDAELHNLYGPTEAAVDVTHWKCEPGGEDGVVPIGRPVLNTKLYILDKNFHPVDTGDAGELHIGGVQVGRGYHNRPELTAERFITDPFAGDSMALLYKTGDLARWRKDGSIEFLGRLDYQVKIRGFRIELGEIEQTLRRHPGVRDAVVTAFLNDHQEQKLAAHLLVDRNRAASTFGGRTNFSSSGLSQRHANWSSAEDLESSIREHCVKWLPEYMIPSVIVMLDEYPLTPNGKLDHSALRLPVKSPIRPSGKEDPPRDELESWLYASWAAILGNEEFGIRTGFFDAGGTSLQAARLVQRLHQRLNEFIYVATVFEAPTIAEYAALLKRQYPHRMRELFPSVKGLTGDGAQRVADDRVLTDAEIRRFQERVPIFRSLGRDSALPLNPPAVFILAPPRSGTTLLRVMLAGHPGLFAAPELQLLHFETLRSRREAFQGKFEAWLEGTIRALMELRGVDADTAKREMEEYESKNLTTAEFYKLLQDAIGERLLLDKTPSYALDPAALEHAELDFQEARFIHLVRHPQAIIRSFEKMHIDQVLFLKDHPYNARQLGELVWLRSHRNILELLAKVPEERQCRIRFEDLLANPREAMERVCAMLQLPYVADMVEPYRNQERKMITGLYRESIPMGDVRFLSFSEIRPDVADSWKATRAEYSLASATWNLAFELGYERDAERAPMKARTSQNAISKRRLQHRTGKR